MYIFTPSNKLKETKMTTFTNRREAILEVHTLENKSDLLMFMGRMVETMKQNILSKLDCDMIADELSNNTTHIAR